ncbi:hypothetical protein AGDE_14239 [Angomonas deanei]|uniref:Uncharacterized protein n=1 Tax=Angomonas deanei TaxID=59799 RepID=A0A7G2C3Y3_9TRYP|nr:hypothetical protein AGDE_14239 [Angomonas deanei]CAD2214299.1 hypothetical protein, conserved [Angomonas deanei]|eukprot:EPY21182.1 hypothetical protein AGDE_14239 [Angomonas deanei]
MEVRQLKQLLLLIVSEKDLEERKLLLASALKIIASSSQACTLPNHCSPDSFIANRRGSGLLGIKAILQEFPQEGYAVSM